MTAVLAIAIVPLVVMVPPDRPVPAVMLVTVPEPPDPLATHDMMPAVVEERT